MMVLIAQCTNFDLERPRKKENIRAFKDRNFKDTKSYEVIYTIFTL